MAQTVASPSRSSSVPTGDLVLRIRGTRRDGQLVRVRAARCVIGSGPDCTLRIVTAGIDPVHCMILRGPDGAIVRAWSRDTRLNGAGVDDTPIYAGDILSVGPIEFEVAECGVASIAPEEDDVVASSLVTQPVASAGAVRPPVAPRREPLPAAPVASPASQAPEPAAIREEVRRLTQRLERTGRQSRTRCRGLIAQLRKNRARIVELQQLSERLGREAEAALQRQAAATSSLAARSTETAALEAERTACKTAQRELEAEKRQIENRQSELQSQEKELADRRRTMDAQRAEIENLRKQFDVERRAADEARNKTQSEESAEVAALEAERTTCETARRELEAEKRQIEAKQSELQSQEKELADQRRLQDAQRTEFKNLRKRLDADEHATAAAKKEIEAREQALASRTGILETALADLEKERTKFAQEREAWQASQHTAAVSPAAESGPAGADREQLQTERQQLEDMQHRLAEERAAEKADAAARLAELEENRLRCQSLQDELRIQQEALETSRRTWHEERTTLNRKIQARVAELDARQTELDVRQTALDAIQQDLDLRADDLTRRESQRPGFASASTEDAAPAATSKSPREGFMSMRVTGSTNTAAGVLGSLGFEVPDVEESKNPRSSRGGLEVFQDRTHDEEEDAGIQEYMSGLMSRLRLTPKTPERREEAPAASASQPEPQPKAQRPQSRPRRPHRKESMAEMDAMRELANLSANHALTKHARRQFLRLTYQKLLVSAICIISSGLLFASWWFWEASDLAIYAGAIGLLAGMFWAIQYAILSGRLALSRSGRLGLGRRESVATPNRNTPASDDETAENASNDDNHDAAAEKTDEEKSSSETSASHGALHGP